MNTPVLCSSPDEVVDVCVGLAVVFCSVELRHLSMVLFPFTKSLKSSERFVALEVNSNRPDRRACNAQKVRDEYNVTFHQSDFEP
jgi:hypothetical protein